MINKIRTLFTYILIPLSLLLLGVFLFYQNLFNNGFGFLNLLTFGHNDNLVSTRNGELLKGDKVYGKFTSTYSNLGIIAVRFSNNNRDSNDILAFRFKEGGSNNWQYEANYNTNQFLPGALFPFGFPQIKDSEGKKYIFELESLSGSTGSGIFIDRTDPTFIAASFIDKSDIVSSRTKTLRFLHQKLLNILSEQDNLTKTVIYFMPAVLYFLHLITAGSSYHLSVLFVSLVAVYDILFLKNSYNSLLFSATLLWILTSIRYRLSYQISAIFSLIFLFLIPIFTILSLPHLAEKSGVWAYLFMCVVCLIQFISVLCDQKKVLTAQKFFKSLTSIKVNQKNTTLKYTLVAALVGAIYFIGIKFTMSFVNIRNGYQQFSIFYPEIFNPPDKIWFSLCLFFITLAFILTIYCTRRYLLRYKPLILLYLLAFSGLLNFTVGKFTNFKYEPKIFSISPQTTSESWVDITISGKNFQDLPFVGKVTLAGEVQVENVHFWSDEKIIFRTNPTTTKSGDVCVSTLSKGKTNCLKLEYRFNKK